METHFTRTLSLFILEGFGIVAFTETLPFVKNYTPYTMLITLIVLSLIVERTQHANDSTIRYLLTDSSVDFLSSLGIKKIIELIPLNIPFISTDYGKFAAMLTVAAVISSIYNSAPCEEE